MGLRSTYNTGVFNSGAYGVPETTQAAASVAVGVSVSASAVTIVEASSSASVAFTASNPTAVRIGEASAAVSLGGIMSVSAIKYDGDVGFRSGYGISTYGTFVYGENYSTKDVSATVSVGVSTSCAAVAVRQSTFDVPVVFTGSAAGFMSIVGAVVDTVSISPDISYNRVRLMSASDDIGAAVDTSARYKWIDAPAPTTSWTQADYLERAA